MCGIRKRTIDFKLRKITMSGNNIIQFGLALSLFSCNNVSEKQDKEQSKPNIIYILADDLGYGDLGCYGQQRIKTPEIDEMAGEGIRFTEHYAGSTVCAPSRCSLLTGLHTGHSRVRGNFDADGKEVGLIKESLTVAEVLKKAGYTTGVIGKWGLGEEGTQGIPNKQGFDYFFGYLNQIRAHNAYTDYLWENQERVELDNKIEVVQKGYAKGFGSVAHERKQHSHDLFTEKALDFISQEKEKPFFLYLAYTLPHANNESWMFDSLGLEPTENLYENKQWSRLEKAYASIVSGLDRDVGKILEHLKKNGIAENTLVIFTSDNGPHAEGGYKPELFNSNGKLRGMKRDLYEGGIRVPFIAWWPSKIPREKTSDHPSAFWDFLPTACDIAGIKAPEQTDGISYLPALLQKDNQKEHDYLYWEFHGQSGKQAIRKGDWKLIKLDVKEKTKSELYHLAKDPCEKNNLIDQNPEIADSLSREIERARTESEIFSFK